MRAGFRRILPSRSSVAEDRGSGSSGLVGTALVCSRLATVSVFILLGGSEASDIIQRQDLITDKVENVPLSFLHPSSLNPALRSVCRPRSLRASECSTKTWIVSTTCWPLRVFAGSRGYNNMVDEVTSSTEFLEVSAIDSEVRRSCEELCRHRICLALQRKRSGLESVQ